MKMSINKWFPLSLLLVFLSVTIAAAAQVVHPQSERDDIYTLAAYVVVLDDWQKPDEKMRGYNIGSVLVDPDGNIVHHAQNSVYATKNLSQHGEVRLITQYLDMNKKISNIGGHTIYTTLEPCAMCSGMMFLTGVTRTVYGQKDLAFGNAIERLKLNSEDAMPGMGYGPYPDLSKRFKFKTIRSNRGSNPECLQLEKAYTAYKKSMEPQEAHITKFLTTSEAKSIYQKAKYRLKNYAVQCTENHKVFSKVQNYLKKHLSNY